MKDKYTIIKEEFNSTTGETIVIINTDIGAFTGKVVLDDTDAQYPSIYHSHELALLKALRKYAKATIVIIKEKMQPLFSVLNQCMYTAEHSSTEIPVFGKATFLIKKEIEKLNKELELWEKRVAATDRVIIKRIATRDAIVQKYINKDKKD